MKINFTILLPLSVMFFACGDGDKKSAQNQDRIDSLSRPENVRVIAAIAKVEPANGFIDLAAEVSGIVTELYKKEGDTVKKGDLLFKLDQNSENLQTTSARQNLITQQSRIEAAKADVQQYEASVKEKEEDLATTKRLAATGADTRQNVAVKSKEKDIISANLLSARAQLKVALSELSALKTDLSEATLNSKNRLVTAKADGILVRFEVKTGSAINALQSFGQLASGDHLVLHGEIDEMFADRVQIGQSLEVNYVGNNKIITKGKVIYLSQILENKSLFYEKTGETSDRRVRRFKASVTEPESLLINGKVECKINL